MLRILDTIILSIHKKTFALRQIDTPIPCFTSAQGVKSFIVLAPCFTELLFSPQLQTDLNNFQIGFVDIKKNTLRGTKINLE